MAKRDSAAGVVAFLGAGVELTGGLSFTGSLRVDGRSRGAKLEGNVLLVGPDADVDGEIRVEVLSVQGRVSGEVHVSERLEILPGGRVAGRVVMTTPCLVLEEGGALEGQVEIAEAPSGKAREARKIAP